MHKLPKIKEGRILLKLFYKAKSASFPKSGKNIHELKITDHAHSWNIAAKILDKTLAKNPELHKKNNKSIISKIVNIKN